MTLEWTGIAQGLGTNVGDIIMNIFKGIRTFAEQVRVFLGTALDLSAIGLGEVSLWSIITVAGLSTLLIAIIVKKIIPLV